MNTGKQVGLWIRVSTEMQVKDESPEHHEKRARLYAEAKGWEVVEVYRLEAVSGKSVMQHPEAQRMLTDIQKGSISGLIFSKLARLARNTKELLEFSELFRSAGADLISLSENIDTSSPAGRLFYTIIAAMAEWERAEIAERVAASIPIRAKLGKPLSGQTSLGYRWKGKEFVIDETEAPIRKLIYETFLKTRRKIATAKVINGMGYRTRNGSQFGKTTIERLLRDSSAKGIRKANHTTGRNGRGAKPKEEWVYTPCPSIVSAELWDECNRILDEQLSKIKKPGPRAVHLLSGYIRCTCGNAMYVYHKDKAPTFRCKPCNTKIAVTDIDHIFHQKLKTFLMTETEVSEFLEKTNFVLKEKEKLLENAKTEIAEIRKQMAELVKMRLQGELNKDSFVVSHKPLEEQVGQLEDHLPELEAEVDYLKIQYLSSDSLLREAKNLYNDWLVLPFERQRSIVEMITNRIEIGKEDINIDLSYLPPTTPQNGGKRDRMIGVVNGFLCRG